MTVRPHDGHPIELTDTEAEKIEGGAHKIKLAKKFVSKRRPTFAAELTPNGGIEGSDIGSGA